jgi:hypothetical protein
MAAPRLYVGGEGGNFGYMDPTTLSWTALASVPGSYGIWSLKVISDTDIWAGLNTGYSGPVKLAHFNGTAWTLSPDLEYPGYYGTVVSDIIAYASDDVWAMAGTSGAPTCGLYHWNGSAWSKPTSGFVGYGSSRFIGGRSGGQPPTPGLVEAIVDDPWGNRPQTWDGVTHLWYTVPQYGPPFHPTGAARLTNGDTYYLSAVQGSVTFGLWVRSGSILGPWTNNVATWPSGGNSADALWTDPVTNVAWMLGGYDWGYYLHRYDGTYTRLEGLAGGGNWHFTLTGAPGAGGGSILYSGGDDGKVKRRDELGSWTSSVALGFRVTSLVSTAGTYLGRKDEAVLAVDSVTVIQEFIPATDDDWILMAADNWVKPQKTSPHPSPDRPAIYNGGTSVAAWDSRRRRVVLLIEPIPTPFTVLQAWDYLYESNEWAQRRPFGGMPGIHFPSSASKDAGLAACFDGVANKVLIYSLNRRDGSPTLWHWDASQITNLTSLTTGLPTVHEPQLVWDESRNCCWLYGYSPTSGRLYELYQFYPSSYSFVDRYVGGTPGTTYPDGRRQGSGFAFDPRLGEVLLTHGGVHPDLFADTWSFNGALWTDRTPAGTEGIEYPEKRTRTALVTAPGEQLYLIGGYDIARSRLRDTWKWKGDLLTWTDVPPNNVMITDVNANMRAIGRYPSRAVVPTQPRVGVAVGVGQVDEAVTATDSATAVKTTLGWDYLRDTNLPTGISAGSLGAWFIFDGTGSSLTDRSGSGTNVYMSHGSENYQVESASGLTGFQFVGGQMMRSFSIPTWLVSNAITLEIQLKFTGSQAIFYSLDHYGPETLQTNGQWSLHYNSGDGYHMFWERGSGSNVDVTLGGFTTGLLSLVTIVRQSDGVTCVVYQNGVEVGSGVAANPPQIAAPEDIYFHLGGEYRVPATYVGWALSLRVLPGVTYSPTQAWESYRNLRI